MKVFNPYFQKLYQGKRLKSIGMKLKMNLKIYLKSIVLQRLILNGDQ